MRLRSSRTLAALLILAGLGAGCSQRPRLNPFDPGNPMTGGRPIGFRAVAADGYITLEWAPSLVSDLLGYRISRRVEGQAQFSTLVDLLPAREQSFKNFALLNGLRHSYRLQYVFERGLSPLYAEDSGTPGALRPWVADFDAGLLTLLTPDGHHVVGAVSGFNSPAAVAVNPLDGAVWVTDPFAAQVIRYDPPLGTRQVATNFSRPSGIAIDIADGGVWVTDENGDDVVHLNENTGSGIPALLGPVDLPTGIAVDPSDRSIWVCGNGRAELKLFTQDGLLRWTLPMQRPSRVAVDSLTREAWVTSFERGVVVRLNTAGVPLDTVGGLAGPIGVTVDPRRGLIWVADALRGELRSFDRAGLPHVRITGLDEVREVAVDLSTGNAWATVRGRGQVVVVTPAGQVIERISGLTGPYGIGLDPGTASPIPMLSRSGMRP